MITIDLMIFAWIVLIAFVVIMFCVVYRFWKTDNKINKLRQDLGQFRQTCSNQVKEQSEFNRRTIKALNGMAEEGKCPKTKDYLKNNLSLVKFNKQ